MSEDLRNRMQRIDPMAAGVPTEPVTSESSRRVLEEIMATKVNDDREARKRRNRGPWYLAAAASLVVIAGGISVFLGGGQPSEPPLRLALGPSDAMGMCIQFSVDILAEMPVAFEGTVASVAGGQATLDVDRWFKGGDAQQVILDAPAAMPALIGGVDFVEDEQYLITATDGTVNACGYSGEATPELLAAFEEAFAG